MKRFEGYPIFINHFGRWEAVRERLLTEFYGDSHMTSWLDTTGRQLDEVTEDISPGWEAREYENQVYKLLMLIGSTRIGKLLFDSLNPNIRHWIVPYDSYIERHAGIHLGLTMGIFTPKSGDGIRTYLNPTDFSRTGVADRWLGADDGLFHELIHAYRFGRFASRGLLRNDRMMGYRTAEEFVAVQMQNVYLSYRGGLRFYRDHKTLISVSKGTAYEWLIKDMQCLAALRWFAENDPFVGAVAKWMHPAGSYNPWRDQPILERMWLDEVNSEDDDLKLKQIPAF
jgi:hypothetical protein